MYAYIVYQFVHTVNISLQLRNILYVYFN